MGLEMFSCFFVLSEVSLPYFCTGKKFPGSFWELFILFDPCYSHENFSVDRNAFFQLMLTIQPTNFDHLLLIGIILLRIIYDYAMVSLGNMWFSQICHSILSLPISSLLLSFLPSSSFFSFKNQRQKCTKILEWKCGAAELFDVFWLADI